MIKRRTFLGGIAFSGLAAAMPAYATSPVYLGGSRTVTLRNVRFNESATFLLERNETLSTAARHELNYLLRDHHSGAVGRMDPSLVSYLMDMQTLLGLYDGTYEIVSAYRSRETNQSLCRKNSKVATNSLHTRGRAIDIRFPGLPMKELRDAALDLGAGGVGYYRSFIHFDTGRVRKW